jgi:hypothetical protein
MIDCALLTEGFRQSGGFLKAAATTRGHRQTRFASRAASAVAASDEVRSTLSGVTEILRSATAARSVPGTSVDNRRSKPNQK